MKKIMFLVFLAVPILLIAACGSKTTDTSTGAQTGQQAAACPEWKTVIEKVTSSDAVLKENSAIMNSPTCQTIDKAITASAQAKDLMQWFDTNLCKTTCFDNQPSKQSICKSVNMDSMNSRHNVLLAYKGTCK